MTTLAHDSPRSPGTAIGHVVPLRLLAGVFAVLVLLTVVTVAVTYIDLGALSIWVALGIAVFKAALVALYFMHLRWDSPYHGMVLIAALFFVILFIGITILDTHQNLDRLEPAPTAGK